MKHIAVIGSGQMGNGIAHVFAQNGFDITIIDIAQAPIDKALNTIEKNLERQVVKGLLTAADKQAAMSNIKATTDLATGVKNADLVIEAAIEVP